MVGRRRGNCGEDAVRVETFKYVIATLRNTLARVVLTCFIMPYTYLHHPNPEIHRRPPSFTRFDCTQNPRSWALQHATLAHPHSNPTPNQRHHTKLFPAAIGLVAERWRCETCGSLLFSLACGDTVSLKWRLHEACRWALKGVVSGKVERNEGDVM